MKRRKKVCPLFILQLSLKQTILRKEQALTSNEIQNINHYIGSDIFIIEERQFGGKWDQGTCNHPEALGPAKISSSGKERTKSPSRFEQALREIGRRQAIYKFTSLSSTALLHKLVTEGNRRQAHNQYQIPVTVLRL